MSGHVCSVKCHPDQEEEDMWEADGPKARDQAGGGNCSCPRQEVRTAQNQVRWLCVFCTREPCLWSSLGCGT